MGLFVFWKYVYTTHASINTENSVFTIFSLVIKAKISIASWCQISILHLIRVLEMKGLKQMFLSRWSFNLIKENMPHFVLYISNILKPKIDTGYMSHSKTFCVVYQFAWTFFICDYFILVSRSKNSKHFMFSNAPFKFDPDIFLALMLEQSLNPVVPFRPTKFHSEYELSCAYPD